MKCPRCKKDSKRCLCPRFGGEQAKLMVAYLKDNGRQVNDGIRDALKLITITGMPVSYEEDLQQEADFYNTVATENEGDAKELHARAEACAVVAKDFRVLEAYARQVRTAFSPPQS